MLHYVKAPLLCQHLSPKKEMGPVRFSPAAQSWLWASMRRQVCDAHSVHRPVERPSKHPCLISPCQAPSERSILTASVYPSTAWNMDPPGMTSLLLLETGHKAATGLCWCPSKMWCHVMSVTSSKLSVFSFLIALFACNHNRKKNALNSQKKKCSFQILYPFVRRIFRQRSEHEICSRW